MRIALDATYSLGNELSGVGVYCREMLYGLAAAHPEARFDWRYRAHRLGRSWSERIPSNCRRKLLADWPFTGSADLYHGLNQRLPRTRLRCAVATFHDLFVLTGEYSTPDFRRRFAEQARHAAMAADGIIAVSDFTARQVTDLLGISRDRIRVVPHGTRPPATVRPVEEREPMILHVGAIQKRKNLVRLVDAFAAVGSQWRLVLAGAAGYGAESIFERIAESSCRERISVAGYVPLAELESLYQRASVLAYPSLDEGFGIPILEAMGAGLPVVTSNCSAMPEVAGRAALFVDPGQTEDLALALVRLTSDLDLRRHLAELGQDRAREFPWDRAVTETWNAYSGLLNGSCGEDSPGTAR
ncbi:MAG: glycosyltransferase family 4 protein [Bryobacteraceae bacterium]